MTHEEIQKEAEEVLELISIHTAAGVRLSERMAELRELLCQHIENQEEE